MDSTLVVTLLGGAVATLFGALVAMAKAWYSDLKQQLKERDDKIARLENRDDETRQMIVESNTTAKTNTETLAAILELVSGDSYVDDEELDNAARTARRRRRQ